MRKFCKKFFLHFGNKLKKYVFANFEEILGENVRKIRRRTILRKYAVKFFFDFWEYSKILRIYACIRKF